jgi:hypothetical protein
VDDFEDYDDVNNIIFYTWEDGYMNNTGMTVGHLEVPYAETDPANVHGGSQAMYMRYDNDGTVNEGIVIDGVNYERSGALLYSEADRKWADAQDWSRAGVSSLTMWFKGIQGPRGSFAAGPPIIINAVGTDIAGTADQFHFAYKKLSGNGVIIAKVLSISNTDSTAKAGVMIRETLGAGSKHAMVVVMPNNRATFRGRIPTDDITTTVGTKTSITVPIWLKLTRSGNNFTAHWSTNGSTWTALGTQLEITMLMDVYVGLCVTSRNVNATCTAEFSNVDIAPTSSVTGDWKSQDIGIEYNNPEQLYVALQDSFNNSAVVEYSDPAATTITAWTEWKIPLSAFNGVNLQSITKLSIGVGDRAATQPGGVGDLYIDDIGLSK